MADLILYFSSNAETMIATKTLKDSGVTPRLLAKPANVASASNLCLSIDETVRGDAVRALQGARLTPQFAA